MAGLKIANQNISRVAQCYLDTYPLRSPPLSIPENVSVHLKKTLMKALKVFVFILPALILICCDPGIGYEYYVQNNSDKVIKVEYHRYYMDSMITIPPRSEIIIAEFPTRGSNPHDEGQNFLRNFDQIYYVPDDSFKITKDFMDRKNWKYNRDIRHFGIIKVGTNKYYLEITNNDIQLINER